MTAQTEQRKNIETVIAIPTKSMGISLILTFLFGSIGMFYSTIVGGLIMLVVEVVFGIFTLGLAFFVTHPICMIWGAIAAKRYNDKIQNG